MLFIIEAVLSCHIGRLSLKKRIILALIILLSVSVVWGQTVSEEEILSIKSLASSIVFENYVGPTTDFSTREEISGIGLFLGRNFQSSPSWSDKYVLYHSYQPEIPEGLDGDILALMDNAGVDHIRNLRIILSSYLQAVYEYREKEADVLAEFITYYNAIYYKNMKHFSSRFKPGVLQYLSPQNAGLSTHYSEWPGKSRIVIPVTSNGISGESKAELDTSIISQPEVVKEMQKEEDKALDSRKDMVEIREEALDEKQKELDRVQETLTEEKAVIEEAIAEKEKELIQVEEDSPAAEELKEEIKEEIRELEEKETVIEEKQEALEEDQKKLDKQEDEIVEMREEIAKDENLLREEQVIKESVIASTDGRAIWFILIERSGSPASFGTLCKITEKGQILKRSSINSIRGNTAVDTKEGLAVIAGLEGANSSVNPLLINTDTLEVIKRSDSAVYAGNRIWTDQDYLYIITRNNSDWALGKYTSKLDLEFLSDISVNPDSAILFEDEYLMIQNSEGTISVLSLEDLKEIQP